MSKAKIVVHVNQVSHRISPYATGACIEDVNHEIYGGIYSQMIFGESFEEPPLSRPIEGFTIYSGNWVVKDSVLHASGETGSKLIANIPELSTGEVGVDVYFDDNIGGWSGLIVKVKEPGVGPDAFIGYEVSLNPQSNKLHLVWLKFWNNREQVKEVSCHVLLKEWISLTVKMAETSIEVFVNGKSVLNYESRHIVGALHSGVIGLRAQDRKIAFRDFWVKTDRQKQGLPFKQPSESDYYGEVSCMWRPLLRGSAQAKFALESNDTFNGSQSQRMTFLSGKGEMGIENQGLNRWGMHFQADKPYEGYVWVKADKPVDFYVALESGDGSKIYGEQKLSARSNEWRRLDFTLVPNETDKQGRFAIKLKNPGSILLGHAFSQPGPWGRFKGLSVRKDVAEGLITQGITVLRYGGSMINKTEYRWKKMLGPRDQRPPYRGTWYPYSTNGWGIIDFIDFCSAAGFLCIPAFSLAETVQDMADFVEYINGPADSEWGSKRVADGHPESYGLKYIQIGNEDNIDMDYCEAFKAKAQVIWDKDPDIILVVGDFTYPGHIIDPYNPPGARPSLEAHKNILDFARDRGKTVWFDVHIWTDEPRNPDQERHGLAGLRDYIHWLGKLSPGAKYKVVVFELNASGHAVRRALSNAHAINELERIGDMVPVVCSANCLQPYKQNDNGWNQGLLFLTSLRVWGQPPYYITQMNSCNYLPLCVDTDFESPYDDLDVTVRKSEDGKTLALQVVNLDVRQVKTLIRLDGFTPCQPTARVIQIRGELDDVNTLDEPEKIVPREEDWKYKIEHGEIPYVFPPHSFTIIRFV